MVKFHFPPACVIYIFFELGKNKNKLRTLRPKNHEKFYEQQEQGPILLAVILKNAYINLSFGLINFSHPWSSGTRSNRCNPRILAPFICRLTSTKATYVGLFLTIYIETEFRSNASALDIYTS